MILNNKGLSYTDEEKIKKRRYNISVALSISTLVAASYNFLPYYFVFFVIFFTSAVTMCLNSLIESLLGENLNRVILLSFMLGVMSWSYLMINHRVEHNTEKAMEFCYSNNDISSQLCNDMHSILEEEHY